MLVSSVKSSPSKCFALMTVDVENAFNSASWSLIMREIYNILCRTIFLGGMIAGSKTEITAVVP